MKLTANELTVLTAICPFESAASALGDTGSTWTDAQELADQTGKSVRSVKGILGSLAKKGLVYTDNDNGEGDVLQCVSEDGAQWLIDNAPEAPVVEADDEQVFETQKQVADYLYTRKGAVFVSLPVVGGSMRVKAPKLPLWNQLMENPTASTSLRVDDLGNGDFLVWSPLN